MEKFGTIVFVHGTGVRLKNYKLGFAAARGYAAAAGIKAAFVECAWGDPLGVEFEGLSLPDPPSEEELKKEEEDFARWSFLLANPLFELEQLTIRDPLQRLGPKPPPGRMAPWEELWTRIASYKPSLELKLLLSRGNFEAGTSEASVRAFCPRACGGIKRSFASPRSCTPKCSCLAWPGGAKPRATA
jgi:hypothetical protein